MRKLFEELEGTKKEWPYGEPCPVCGGKFVGSCRCPGPHNLEDLRKGHGRQCENGHRVSSSAENRVAVDKGGAEVPRDQWVGR